MAICDTPSAALSAQGGNMRRPRHGPKEGVLQMLRTVANAGQLCDLKMLKRDTEMPRFIKGHEHIGRRPGPFRSHGRARQSHLPRCKLDSSARLIAPPHSLRLPTLAGVRTRFQFSTGTQAVLPVARLLINQGLLVEKHLE